MPLPKMKDDGDAALFDRVFDSFFDFSLPVPRFAYAPAPLDLYERDGKYFLEIAAPGYDPNEVNVEVSGATVTVSGEHTEKSEKKDARYHRREMRRGAFSRTVTLPQDIDANAVSAKIEKGVLQVELSPLKPISPKKVEVKGA